MNGACMECMGRTGFSVVIRSHCSCLYILRRHHVDLAQASMFLAPPLLR